MALLLDFLPSYTLVRAQKHFKQLLKPQWRVFHRAVLCTYNDVLDVGLAILQIGNHLLEILQQEILVAE